MRNTLLTIIVLLLFVPTFSGNTGLLSQTSPSSSNNIGQFGQIQKTNIYFSIGAYPFKMASGDDGELTGETEIGPTIGLDFPVAKNNFGIKFTFFDGKDNVEYWNNYDGGTDLKILILDFYAMRQYNLVKKLDAYVQVGVPIKMVRGYFTDDSDEEIPLDYTTLGIAGEVGLKYRLLKHMALKTGYYQSIMFKGSHIGYFPFFGLNFYF